MVLGLLGLFLLALVGGIIWTFKDGDSITGIVLIILGGFGSLISLVIIPCTYVDNIKKLEMVQRTYPAIVVNEISGTDDIAILDASKLDNCYFPVTFLASSSSSNYINYQASNLQIINIYNRELQYLRTTKDKDIFAGVLVPEIPKYLRPVVLINK